MNVRTITQGLPRTTSWRKSLVAGGSLVIVLSLATLVSSATPSFASMKSANGSAYCKLLTSYDKKQAAANKELETPGAAKAAMELAFKNLKPEENLILGVVPGSLKSSYESIFKDVNVLYADLAKADFDFEKLTKAQIAAFEAESKSMTAASNKINAYNKNVCGVKD